MISERAFSQAFHSFWKELLPFLTSHYITLFNEAYEVAVLDDQGNPFSELELPEALDRADVASELGFRLAKLAHTSGVSLFDREALLGLLSDAVSEVQANLHRHEGRQSDIEPTNIEIDEALDLCARYADLPRLLKGAQMQWCPPLKGFGFINSCEADLAAGPLLVEVKTTTRRVSGRDLRQILVYLALDAAQKTYRWSSFGIFNPRRAAFSCLSVETFIAYVSGGRTVHDVCADILSFAESSDLLIEKRF